MAYYTLPSGLTYNSSTNTVSGSQYTSGPSYYGGTYSGGGGSSTPAPAPAPPPPPPEPTYVNMGGAYFEQTDSGLSAVSDPAVLQGLISGTTTATAGPTVGTGGGDLFSGLTTTGGSTPSSNYVDPNATFADGTPIYTPEQQESLVAANKTVYDAGLSDDPQAYEAYVASTTPQTTQTEFTPTYVPPTETPTYDTTPDTSGEGGTETPADGTTVNNFTGLGNASGLGGGAGGAFGTGGLRVNGGVGGDGELPPGTFVGGSTGGGAAGDPGALAGGVMTPEQAQDYFASQSGAANPLSPAEYLNSLNGGDATPNPDVQAVIDAQNQVVDPKLIEEADAGLEEAGVDTSPPKEGDSPYTYGADKYQQILESYGVEEIKAGANEIQEEINKINDELAEEIATINENPWISEAARAKKVNGAVNKADLKLAGKQSAFDAMIAKSNQLIADARWRASQAMTAYFQTQQLDLQRQKFAFDQAEALAKANAEKDLKFVSGTANQPSGYWDPNTRTFTPLGGGPSSNAYTGEFSGIIDTAANLVGSARGKTSKIAMQNALSEGNYALAYALIANNVEESLTGTTKSRFADTRTDYNVMSGMRDAIKAYTDADGDIGVLKGTAQEIASKLGQLATDPEFAALGTQLTREFQTYRNIMTGAAFTPEESADYAKVNPRTNASLDLNLAVIDGALAQLENRVVSTVNTRVPGSTDIYNRSFGIGSESSMSDEEAYQLYLETLNPSPAYGPVR